MKTWTIVDAEGFVVTVVAESEMEAYKKVRQSER